ncbi:AraC family transcriptional regulator [Gorillibacterium sp. sgz5001074]|uniref:AraC family transcriptional regulator n=1 Tax=Gorillibacterium sp. sgz5001074 TaxID=3446695 RepID=UPI003F66F9FA
MDYIEARLGEPMTLDELAGEAGFSKYHFHRIFQAGTGETLFGCIQRLRLEKGARLLAASSRKSVTEVALETGFASSSAFARSFKQHFGVTATEWRSKGGSRDDRNLGIPDRNRSEEHRNCGQSFPAAKVYIEYAGHIQRWKVEMEMEQTRVVEVKEIPAWTVAYVRYVGPYAGDGELFQRLNDKLMRWAGARGLVRFPESRLLNVYHDDPGITEEEKLRISVCLTVPEDTETDGEIGRMTLAPGKYAFARFTVGTDGFGEAWAWVYGQWLPQSGYEPDDRLCFELYHGGPDADGKFTVDICVPVKPV